MISLPDSAGLQPQVCPLPDGHNLYLFPSDSTPLVRIDFIHEAGSAYQPQPLCAAAANRLFTKASDSMSAAEVSEFMDYRGIIVEHSPSSLHCTTTVYLMRRYFDELLPVLVGLLHEPSFTQESVDVWLRKRKQELMERSHKTNKLARRLYYQTLFGSDHPLGRYAEPSDADRLTRDAVMHFFHERYSSGADIVLSGNIDDSVYTNNNVFNSLIGTHPQPQRRIASLGCHTVADGSSRHTALKGAVQTSLRAGRVLPVAWNDPEYARLMLLTTLLGGYFGSRLMSNLREDKGYTYGVNARTQIFRGVIVFYIVTDVAAGTAEAAESEMKRELQRLCDTPVDTDELQMVKQVMVGDFLRSVDGIFERAERFCQMHSADVDERLTDNLRAALASATPADLQATACRWLRPEQMLWCRAGAEGDMAGGCQPLL